MEEKETQLPMRKFRVVSGTHQGKKKTYTKGQIVKSEKDLCALFVGKFVEVGKREDEEVTEAADKAKAVATKLGGKSKE